MALLCLAAALSLLRSTASRELSLERRSGAERTSVDGELSLLAWGWLPVGDARLHDFEGATLEHSARGVLRPRPVRALLAEPVEP